MSYLCHVHFSRTLQPQEAGRGAVAPPPLPVQAPSGISGLRAYVSPAWWSDTGPANSERAWGTWGPSPRGLQDPLLAQLPLLTPRSAPCLWPRHDHCRWVAAAHLIQGIVTQMMP